MPDTRYAAAAARQQHAAASETGYAQGEKNIIVN